MADPTHGPYGSPLLDDFNRADGDPGSNWIALSPVAKLPITSQVAVATGVAGMKWFQPPISPDCEIWGKVGGDGSGRVIFYARANGTDLYQLSCVPDNNAVLHLLRYVGGVGWTSLAQGPTPNIASGRWIGLACSGSLIQAFLWDGSAWRQECSAVDTAVPGAGDIAVYCDVAGHTSTLDNFGGGWFDSSLVSEELELAYGYGPRDADPVFISVADLPGGRSRQRSFSFTRTRSDELDRYDAAGANATLTNTDAALSSENTASPYEIKPRTPIRYTVNGVVMYYGFTGGFPQVYPNVKDAVVNLQALDRLSLLGRRNFQGATVFAEGLSGQRFYDVLVTKLGYTAADVDLDPGTATLPASVDLIGTNPLDYLQTIAIAEGGRFFASRDGKFTFRDRQRFLEQFAATFGVFGNENDTQIPYRLVNDEIAHDETKIFNGIYITDAVGGIASAVDATSQGEYDELDYNATWPIAAADAVRRSGQLLHDRKDPHQRIPALEILHTRNPAVCWPVIMMLEIGQRFAFRYQPFAAGSDLIEMDVTVDGISISSTDGGKVFRVIVQLAPADMTQYWLAGVAGYSEAGVTTFAG
ncbi:MAG: hypothetical protein M0R37_12815 [Bacteroidales bacterium]|nr:hypothetical protein [Bacteroidales bacterium]